MVLSLLKDTEVRITVVLTKAGMLGYGSAADQGRGEDKVNSRCLEVWDELREIEWTSLT